MDARDSKRHYDGKTPSRLDELVSYWSPPPLTLLDLNKKIPRLE